MHRKPKRIPYGMLLQIDSVLEPAADAKQRKRQATEAEMAAYMRDRAEIVARVRDFVEQHNLRAVDPLGAAQLPMKEWYLITASANMNTLSCQ